jgi:hypothetical protein
LTASPAWAQARAHSTIKCASSSTLSVTWAFYEFPNAENNLVKERVKLDGVNVNIGTFVFNGPTGSNTVTIALSPGHHEISVFAHWNTNGSKFENDHRFRKGIECAALSNKPHISVGYADTAANNRGGPEEHPTPWQGSAGVTFIGCGFGGADSCPKSKGVDIYDAGAIRIDATSDSGAVSVTGGTVVIGPCTYEPWPGLNVTVEPEQTLVLTETGKHQCTSIAGAEQDNFDTSESFLKSTQYQEFLTTTGKCSNDGYIPEITLTINGQSETLQDTAQILNTGGFDPDICTSSSEFREWSRIQ